MMRGVTIPLFSKLMEENHKKTIILDMDGTLYEFKGGSFINSGLYDVVIENSSKYIEKKLKKNRLEAQVILNSILKEYGNSISIGLEKEFEVDRYEYFDFVWDIDVKQYVQFNQETKKILIDLKKDFGLVLLSDAPKIWIKKVLGFLEIQEIFGDNIFSGEGNTRKEFGNAFGEICKAINRDANDCIAVGDQEETDIIPAKEIGMKTVFVGNTKNSIADYKIKNIYELKNLFKIC